MFGLALALLLAASPDPEPLSTAGPLRLDLPLVDLPFNARGVPSMAQALAVSRDVETAMAWAIDLGFSRLGWNPAIRWLVEGPVIALAAIATVWTPFGTTWNHEEFHRAAMTWRGVSSYDDVYRFPFFSEAISVSHVIDEDLVRLKAEHPAELVRVHAAGMEGDVELARSLSQSDFFDGHLARPNLTAQLLTRVGVVGYLFTCNSSVGDADTDKWNAIETTMPPRDFTGLDCVAWAYDVQRPDEPYSARGPHPTGLGLNRYRKTTDLTAQERTLLTTATWLSLANLIDLPMWDLAFPVPGVQGWSWSAGLGWQMTSFGHAMTLDVLARSTTARLRFTARLYLAQALDVPGLEAELVRQPLQLGPVSLELTPTVSLWLQPANQRWDARTAAPGALVKLRVGWRFAPRFSIYGELQGKTAGWVPAVVSLDPAVEGRLGVSAIL